MPKKTNAAGERQNTEAARLLNEYRAILQNNDHMISGLEVMQKIPEPTISQRARMKELEEQLIPDGIQKEKELGARIRQLVAGLQGEGSLPEIRRRTVIELRYLSQLEWPQIAEALYPDEWDEAPLKRRKYLIRQAFRYHASALDQLDELFRAGDQ